MRIIALAVCLAGMVLTVFGQQSYWQQQVNYAIDVSLNDEEHTLTGFERMEYINNSPDTLRFIYIHLWPNAYKNDRTTFSEQLLKNDRTDFYFSDEDQRGYINQMEFRVNNAAAIVEQDPLHIDIIKLSLEQPLAPKQSVEITTPFHVKLPYNFSRGGHAGQSYQVTQWYPKAALYDKDGWHPIPYVDQGEFYNDFGNYKVNISLAANYKVGATGVLQGREETEAAGKKKQVAAIPPKVKKPFFPKKKVEEDFTVASSRKQQTLHYTAGNVSDFAWFADKSFIVKTDTIQLATHTVKASCYILPEHAELYANSMRFIKQAVRFYSSQLGEYPFPEVKVVSCPKELTGPTSMEYPMIVLLCEATEEELDATIAHEIGHNWLMAILSTNERDHGWMDEGINTYFERKYRQMYYPEEEEKNTRHINFSGLNGAGVHLLLSNLIALKKDQPIETTSEAFSDANYGAVVYEKTADWMDQLEHTVGATTMRNIMLQYYKEYAFKHPQPEDFRKVAEEVSAGDLSVSFRKLNGTGLLDSSKLNKSTQFKLLLPGFDDKHNYITASPIAGYNSYDQFMIGGVIHNYQFPLKPFQFLVAPMYATGSSRVTGAARVSYNNFKKRSWLELSASGITYSANDYLKDDGSKLYLGMSRLVPSVKFTWYNTDLREKSKWIFQLRSFILNEEQLQFNTITTPSDTFDVVDKFAKSSVINELKATYENNRLLYPYNVNITINQGSQFLRAGITGNYYFNYKQQGKGINARVFGGKFFYLTSKTYVSSYETDRYHLNLSGPNGSEDYTFSNYFAGRNEFEGFKSQQMIERDGFFKVRTDLLGNKIGKTDDWLLAVNFSGDIPDNINPLSVLPFKVPIKFFVDLGTYSDAWKDNAETGRFLYDAGLQLALFNSGLNIYFPILYSKTYGDYFKSTLGEKRFWKTVTFNINFSVLQPSKIFRDLPL